MLVQAVRTEVLVTARRVAVVVAPRRVPRVLFDLRPQTVSERAPLPYRSRVSPVSRTHASRRIVERRSIGIEGEGSPSMEPQLRSLAWEFRGVDGRKVVGCGGSGLVGCLSRAVVYVGPGARNKFPRRFGSLLSRRAESCCRSEHLACARSIGRDLKELSRLASFLLLATVNDPPLSRRCCTL